MSAKKILLELWELRPEGTTILYIPNTEEYVEGLISIGYKVNYASQNYTCPVEFGKVVHFYSSSAEPPRYGEVYRGRWTPTVEQLEDALGLSSDIERLIKGLI